MVVQRPNVPITLEHLAKCNGESSAVSRQLFFLDCFLQSVISVSTASDTRLVQEHLY